MTDLEQIMPPLRDESRFWRITAEVTGVIAVALLVTATVVAQ